MTQELNWISTLAVKGRDAHGRCIAEAGGFLPRGVLHRWAIITGGKDLADAQSPVSS